MTKVQFTDPYDRDGRLKVLWLDDKGQEGEMLISEAQPQLTDSRRYTPWFAITSITSLSDLRALHEVGQPKTATHEYDVPDAPYDIYVLDFRLCDAKEHCKDKNHVREGLHAPAAGLLGGMLTALNWPSHPQAVIPYSGYPEEIGEIWQLCSQFRPDGLHLAGAVTTKSRQDFDELLTAKVAGSYRAALQQAFAAGKAAIPSGEHQRVSELLEDAGDWIDATAEIEIATAYGLRTFKFGALFFDQVQVKSNLEMVPAAKLKTELLDVAPVTDPIARQARQLAELFWTLRITDQSQRAYDAIRHGRIPSIAQTIPWIGAPLWRPGRRAKKDNFAPTLVVRLAILMLILFEYRLRLDASRFAISEETRTILRYMKGIMHRGEDMQTLIDTCASSSKAAQALIDAEKLQGAVEAMGFETAIDLVELRLPLNATDLVQLLDPLPAPKGGDPNAKGAYAKAIGEDTRIGKGFASLLDGAAIGDESKTIDLADLISGDATNAQRMLLPSEWAALNRIAVELLFREAEMPGWLSNSGRR